MCVISEYANYQIIPAHGEIYGHFGSALLQRRRFSILHGTDSVVIVPTSSAC
jgi:hypothetical protein